MGLDCWPVKRKNVNLSSKTPWGYFLGDDINIFYRNDDLISIIEDAFDKVSDCNQVSSLRSLARHVSSESGVSLSHQGFKNLYEKYRNTYHNKEYGRVLDVITDKVHGNISDLVISMRKNDLSTFFDKHSITKNQFTYWLKMVPLGQFIRWRVQCLGLKRCVVCKESKPKNQFHFNNVKNSTRHSRCKSCCGRSDILIRSLRRDNPLPENHCCTICGVDAEGLSKRYNKKVTFHLDHCHKTDRFRSYLCPTCNSGLGLFKDNTDIMHKAILYLQEHTGYY